MINNKKTHLQRLTLQKLFREFSEAFSIVRPKRNLYDEIEGFEEVEKIQGIIYSKKSNGEKIKVEKTGEIYKKNDLHSIVFHEDAENISKGDLILYKDVYFDIKNEENDGVCKYYHLRQKNGV